MQNCVTLNTVSNILISDHGSKNKVTYFGSRYSRPDDDLAENDRRFRRSSTSDDDQDEGKLSIISHEVQRSGSYIKLIWIKINFDVQDQI